LRRTYRPFALAALMLTGFGLTQAAQAEGLKPIRIIMVGDSTMTDKSGYGKGFCAQFAPEVTCINAARGGRSSKSYRVEGLWDKIIAQLHDKGAYSKTYVWIGFGHNDGSAKPERHTDIHTEFPLNMRQYGKDIVAAGATPVFVTPLTQRHFRNGKLQSDLLPWATAVKLEAANGGYRLVDIYAETQKAVQAMGIEASLKLAGQPVPDNVLAAAPTGTTVPAVFSDASQGSSATVQAFDYTHVGPEGSAYFGKFAVDLWAKDDAAIRPYVK
jgi:lysophospholipase L1-like esterase